MRNHPNKLSFIGVLAIIDQPSDKAPNGARGHRVLLTKKAAVNALDTLIGMGINVPLDGTKHDARAKVGIIETAQIERDRIIVSGYLFAMDCPDVISRLAASADYGMSYELADARVDDIRQDVWTLTKVTFTGAAVLPRTLAAYRLTDFVLVD